jgi:hypothetical protein
MLPLSILAKTKNRISGRRYFGFSDAKLEEFCVSAAASAIAGGSK